MVQVQLLKTNSLFFKVFAESLSNLVHDFWENCFRQQKLLLAANRLIYLNMSIGMSKYHGPRHPRAHSLFFFLHRITIYGATNS